MNALIRASVVALVLILAPPAATTSFAASQPSSPDAVVPPVGPTSGEVAGAMDGDAAVVAGTFGAAAVPDAVVTTAAPTRSFAMIPACPGNDIDSGVVDRCPQALTGCHEPDVLQWWVYSAPFEDGRPRRVGEPGWTFAYTLCAGSDAIDPAIPAYSLTEFQRLPLPPGTSNVEPPTGQVYITVPTNVYASDTDPVLIDTTLAGLPITVRATPARWSWDFGETDPDHPGRPRKGSQLGPTTIPGAPYPNLLNTYAYATRGDHTITMTTHYTGEYTLDAGTTWLPITGEATVTSPPFPLHALGGHSVLVDDLVDVRDSP